MHKHIELCVSDALMLTCPLTLTSSLQSSGAQSSRVFLQATRGQTDGEPQDFKYLQSD